jgi:serine/threonine-protein kinase
MVYRGILGGSHSVDREVAVKVFDIPASEDQEQIVHAVAHATRQAACVRHPNVVHTYEMTVTSDRRPVVISELIEGTTLPTLVEAHAKARRRFTPDLALFVATEVAEGCAGAREARTPDGEFLNLCHLDLASREVLISSHGEVKVTDFGLGPAMRGSSAVRSMRSLARRLATMAPEVACGDRGDARTDVFAIGVILRELLVGPRFPPNVGDADRLRLAREGYIHAGLFTPSLPRQIDTIIRCSLEKDPADRWPHAGLMAFELRRACLSMGVGDARLFLRTAMTEMLAHAASSNDDATVPARVTRSGGRGSGQV